eukprot:CAMPEP_0201528110 /NCGR_PEP_ID=MMETSP0161_2-20130828/37348_1 /ASSEMBLY_ACC=CAM_ASM_000251 /TAXON_ID=180227 /ORGANISM="Neoparamoeba aestuarina, Strain SoJaBio B1-5/56/2" /LENGTH=72 /DNA_ID=CAMNT_0047929257 /DNA_START=559 /DNA_END=777 /DNA_ORIENTATION=+
MTLFDGRWKPLQADSSVESRHLPSPSDVSDVSLSIQSDTIPLTYVRNRDAISTDDVLIRDTIGDHLHQGLLG